MADRSMSNALARTLSRGSQRAAAKEEDLASKKRALASPEVDAFIKQGAECSPSERFGATAATRGTARGAQLNVRIPEELYHRARRAVFENQMSSVEPGTLQDLVSQALSAELRRLGY
jgi:hypothetical protein